MKQYFEHGNEWYIVTQSNLIGVQRNGIKKWVRVEDDTTYTYKLMKTKIKAAGGAVGLYKYLVRCINDDFALCNVEKVLNYIFFEMREYR